MQADPDGGLYPLEHLAEVVVGDDKLSAEPWSEPPAETQASSPGVVPVPFAHGGGLLPPDRAKAAKESGGQRAEIEGGAAAERAGPHLQRRGAVDREPAVAERAAGGRERECWVAPFGCRFAAVAPASVRPPSGRSRSTNSSKGGLCAAG